MHIYFGEWYRSAGISPENIPLPKRWEAVRDFDVDAGEVTSLVQLFYQLNLSDPSFPEKFRKAFYDKDPSFQMSGNDRELIVLAGAELVDAIERSSRDVADLAAMCLVCASVQNVRATPAVPQIPEIAAKYLSSRSVQRCVPEKDGAEDKLLQALVVAGEPYDALGPEFQKMQLQLPIIAEESNMLWWLFSDTSRDLDQRWGSLPLGAVCLVAASELAALTRVIPGPVAAWAFLDRVARSGRTTIKATISISEAINETPKTWRDTNFQKPFVNELNGILPMHQAARLSVEASDDSAWRAMFKTATGLSASAKAAPDKLAYQIFLEYLTARCFDLVKDA